MTDLPSEDEPGRGPAPTEDAEVLDAFLRASHDLYRHSLPPELLRRLPATDATAGAPTEATPGATDAPGRSAAAAAYALCDLTGIDPAFRLHTLARAVNRAPALVPEVAPAIGQVVGVDGTGLAGDAQTELTARLRSFAGTRRAGEGLTHARWAEFVAAVGGPGNVAATVATDDRVPLADLPACNDEETVATARGGAAAVRSSFRTNRPLEDVRPFVDPRQWAECGRPYWLDMTMRGGPESRFGGGTGSGPGTPGGWVAVFREEVDVPIVGPVAVHLRVRYRETADFVAADYRLAAEPGPGDKVTFDSGWLYATAAAESEGGGTHVEGLKAIRFAEPIYNTLPDLACDSGWVHFMIGMALGCGGRPTGATRRGPTAVGQDAGPTGPQDEVLAAVGAITDEWVDAVGRSMRSHGASLTSAMGRALAPTPDPRWVNDLVGMGEGAVTTAEATLDAWRRSLAELRKLGGA